MRSVSGMANTSEKPPLNRQNLKAQHIVFDERVHGENESKEVLPTNVNSVRKRLLNFGRPIYPYRTKELEEEYELFAAGRQEDQAHVDSANEARYGWSLLPPDQAYWRPEKGMRDPDEAEKMGKASKMIDDSSKIAKDARNRERDAESGWRTLLERKIFDLLISSSDEADPDEFLEGLCLQKDVHWNENFKWPIPGLFDPCLNNPKPDITYAYPIFDVNNKHPKECEEDDYFETFSYTFLKGLQDNENGGLQSTPTTGLRKKHVNDLMNPDLLCFPWAVVEFKHARVKEAPIEFCYCQAANGSAAAFGIYKALFEKANRHPDRIPPIVAFTCIGPEVKVWLTFEDLITSERKMVCIFATDVRLTWGALSVRKIFDNTQVWAKRLKGRISECLRSVHMKSSGWPIDHADMETSLKDGKSVTRPGWSRYTQHLKSPVQSHFVVGQAGPSSLIPQTTEEGAGRPLFGSTAESVVVAPNLCGQRLEHVRSKVRVSASSSARKPRTAASSGFSRISGLNDLQVTHNFKAHEAPDGNHIGEIVAFQSVTAMPEHENFSFEELRLNDLRHALGLIFRLPSGSASTGNSIGENTRSSAEYLRLTTPSRHIGADSTLQTSNPSAESHISGGQVNLGGFSFFGPASAPGTGNTKKLFDPSPVPPVRDFFRAAMSVSLSDSERVSARDKRPMWSLNDTGNSSRFLDLAHSPEKANPKPEATSPFARPRSAEPSTIASKSSKPFDRSKIGDPFVFNLDSTVFNSLQNSATNPFSGGSTPANVSASPPRSTSALEGAPTSTARSNHSSNLEGPFSKPLQHTKAGIAPSIPGECPGLAATSATSSGSAKVPPDVISSGAMGNMRQGREHYGALKKPVPIFLDSRGKKIVVRLPPSTPKPNDAVDDAVDDSSKRLDQFSTSSPMSNAHISSTVGRERWSDDGQVQSSRDDNATQSSVGIRTPTSSEDQATLLESSHSERRMATEDDNVTSMFSQISLESHGVDSETVHTPPQIYRYHVYDLDPEGVLFQERDFDDTSDSESEDDDWQSDGALSTASGSSLYVFSSDEDDDDVLLDGVPRIIWPGPEYHDWDQSTNGSEIEDEDNIFTEDDTLDLRRNASRTLDGSMLTSLDIFQTILNRATNVQLHDAIKSRMFCLPVSGIFLVLRPVSDMLSYNKPEVLGLIYNDLTAALRLRAIDDLSVQEAQGVIRSILVEKALEILYKDGKTDVLQRIFTNIISGLNRFEWRDALINNGFNIESSDWAEMDKQAFESINGTY